MIRPHRALRLVALLACAAAPAAAQEPRPAVRAAQEPGWVGISAEVLAGGGRSGVTTSATVTVTDVRLGSPAARAGVRVGDVLVSINGQRTFPRDLRVGDTVRVVLERDGRQQLVTLRAEPRPVGVEVAPTWTMTLRVDSVADRMYRAMDSLRLSLQRDGLGHVRVFGARGLPDPPLHGEAGTWRFDEVRAPFEFHIFRGESHDSLRREMDRLNVRIRDLRSRHASRVRELAGNLRETETRIDRSDPVLRDLEGLMVETERRAAALREAMEAAARREALRGERGPRPFRLAPPGGAEAEAEFRPLDPYLLGRNRAAGAGVVDLRPELADYFGVDGGVLVVDVPERTPAALAGLQPGDVVIEIGSTPVRSIQELRVGLSAAGEIPVTVVRKGARLQLLLGR